MATKPKHKPVPATPELDKMKAVHEDSQKLGEFLAWLDNRGVELMEWTDYQEDEVCRAQTPRTTTEVREVNGLRELATQLAGGDPSTVIPIPDPERGRPHDRSCVCEGTGIVSVPQEGLVQFRPPGSGAMIERILAMYYGIDIDKANEEREAVFQSIRQ